MDVKCIQVAENFGLLIDSDVLSARKPKTPHQKSNHENGDHLQAEKNSLSTAAADGFSDSDSIPDKVADCTRFSLSKVAHTHTHTHGETPKMCCKDVEPGQKTRIWSKLVTLTFVAESWKSRFSVVTFFLAGRRPTSTAPRNAIQANEMTAKSFGICLFLVFSFRFLDGFLGSSGRVCCLPSELSTNNLWLRHVNKDVRGSEKE